MLKYFVEVPQLVELKKQIGSTGSPKDRKLQRLYDILGDVTVSEEFITGYLEYFSYSHAKRGSLALTEESLIGMYEISKAYPQLTSTSIKLIMGEYVKDLFDEVEPLSYFDGMSLEEKDESFESFLELLKQTGEKSDIPYKQEADKLDLLTLTYGERFVEYLKKRAIKYHKTYEEIYYSIPSASVIRKDADLFYEVASKELFGCSGYPYSYKMCDLMILHGDVIEYEGHKLMYSSSKRGDFESPITTDEFLKSIKTKRQKIKIKVKEK